MKKHYHLLDIEKHLTKSSIVSIKKEKTVLKRIYEKPAAGIIFNREAVSIFPKFGSKTRISVLTISIQHCARDASQDH